MMSEDRFQFLVFCLLCILPVAGSIRHTFELFRYYDFYVDSKNPKEWYFPLNIWTEQELNVSLATDSNSSVVSVTFSICHVRSADETNLKKTVQTALVSKPNEYASLILTNLTALPIERCPINVSESMDKPFATEYGVLILRLYSQEIRGRGTLAIGPLSRSRVDEVRLLKGERLKLNLSLTENFQDAALEITVRCVFCNSIHTYFIIFQNIIVLDQ
jgi:hypothetical protein